MELKIWNTHLIIIALIKVRKYIQKLLFFYICHSIVNGFFKNILQKGGPARTYAILESLAWKSLGTPGLDNISIYILAYHAPVPEISCLDKGITYV